MRRPRRLSSRPTADLFELLENAVMRDQENLVETELLNPLQPAAGLVRRADQCYVGGRGEVRGSGPVGEIDGDVGEDGVGAARFAIDAHAGFEILPAAVAAGRGPALALFRGIGDPARAAPGAHQDRRTALAAGPDRQGAAVDRLAAPYPMHGFQRIPQCSETMVVIAAEQLEIRPRRAAADAQ